MVRALATLLALATHLWLGAAPETTAARQFRWAALDQQAELNLDSALVLLRAARAADPSYFPAQLDYVHLLHARFEHDVLARESARLIESVNAADRCLGLVAKVLVESRSIDADLRALARTGGPTICSQVYLARTFLRARPDSMVAAYTRVTGAAPELAEVWEDYAGSLMAAGKAGDAERVLERGRELVGHPVLRTRLAIVQVGLRLARGDTVGALALRRTIRAAMARDGRPGLLAAYEANPCARHVWNDVGEDQSATQSQIVDAKRRAGDWAWAARTLIGCGRALMDRGEPATALRYLTRAVVIADSARRPDLLLETYTQRGRAHINLGHRAEAERDLQRALVLGVGAGRVYNVADAHHNLAHMYEGAAQWRAAASAIDHYVASSRRMNGGQYLTSLIDAGEIRWKAGWHAGARVAFDEMVRVIDAEHLEHFWAGEYYERLGDLQRARDYYVKARAESPGNSRALAALTRVYAELGQLDSAAAIARVHDSQEAVWPPLELPLTPVILARGGKRPDAVRTMQTWAERQERRGNIHGSTLAFLALAQLAIDARSASAALQAATRAERLAATLNLARERTRAVLLRGAAMELGGRSDDALTILRQAATMARSDSIVEPLFDAELALGNAYAARAIADSALAAYERAAAAGERLARSLSTDLDRARYRDRHLLPFDGAITVLLRKAPDALQLDRLMAWSARRKAAALTPRAHAAVTSRAALQRALDTDETFLDYLVLDSVVAVIVVSRERASVIPLAIRPDSLAAMVARLRRPFAIAIGGRVDLARAPFDLRLAAELRGVLIDRPLAGGEPNRRLTIAADGSLHGLPFEALVATSSAGRARDYAGARYLIDDFEVEYVPSVSSLLNRHAERPARPLSGSRLLVVAHDAPGSSDEARALRAEWLRGPVTILDGARATEHATTSALSSFDIVHFATHAEASTTDPLASHLRLARDSMDDGFLHLDEVAALRLHARLVVLSACETTAGPAYNGEGVMSLARAFLASGANSVVGTQWPIGAATVPLMTELYRGLSRGAAPAAALRDAKLRVRSKAATAHPFYWAAPVLISGSSPVR